MNQIAKTEERTPINSVGITAGATGAKIAPQNLAEVVKFAEVMSRADIALPKHLRGNTGACMAVALQALEWQMSPFAVAAKSYTVNGAIAYEAQLIAAVVNTRSGIKGRLKYRFDGAGPDMTCTVIGVLDGEECEYTSPRIGDITTKNSPLWKSDPQQQLGYFSARSWARRHCPEVILGVYDRDEAEQFRGPDNAKDVTPLAARLTAGRQSATDAHEGFDAAGVAMDAETASTDFDGDASSDLFDTSNTDSAAPSSPAEQEGDGDTSSPSSPSPLSADERAVLWRFAKDILPRAGDQTVPGATIKAIEGRWAADLRKLSDQAQEMARRISQSVRLIIKGEDTVEDAAAFFAQVLDGDQAELMGVAV